MFPLLELPPKLGVKPPAEAVFGAPKEGVKPVEAAAGFEVSVPFVVPNEGTKPDVLEGLGADGPVEALNDGVKPVDGLGADEPTDVLNEGVKPELGAEAFGASGALFSDVEVLLPPIAFENRFEVAVAGGVALNVVEDFGVGVEGSAGRERLDES